MNLSYFHVAVDVPASNKYESAVVIDILRATTTIAWALTNGADSIRTFADINLLNSAAAEISSSERILLGERGGQMLDGFDLGNSPLGVSKEVVKGKQIFMSTTNGTRSLDRVRDSENLYTLALPNRKAVGERLINDSVSELCILGSGWEGSYSLEDSLAAGALASFLLLEVDAVKIMNDELYSAIALWKNWENNIEGCLRIASHGQRLARIGNHDDDFACCSKLDNLSVVPKQTEKGVLRAS